MVYLYERRYGNAEKYSIAARPRVFAVMRGGIMDGRTFRYHDNHEFFHAATAIEAGTPPPAPPETVARKRPKTAEPVIPPATPSGEHRRHCTAVEIAQELGYSVSYILAVKKAMYPDGATRPRRLDPVEVSEWIFAHPSFRMRDMYECHPKDVNQGQRLLEI